MIQRQYEYFWKWRVRNAISINRLTIDQAMNVNNMGVDDYCNYFSHKQFSYKNITGSFTDVAEKPISVLANDIQIAFRDYITFESNYQYYQSWAYDNQTTCGLVVDFIDKNIHTDFIEKSRVVFEDKVTSSVNFFTYFEGSRNLDWLIDLLNELVSETNSELNKLELNLRMVDCSQINALLEKRILNTGLTSAEEKVFIEYYLKMSSFDICRKSLFYLDSFIEYVYKANSSKHLFNDENDLNNSDNPKSEYSFDLIFKNEYKIYADRFLEKFISFNYPTNENKYWYRLYYDEMVKIGIAKSKSTGLSLVAVANCFKSKFPEMKVATFQDNRNDGNFDELKDLIQSDIKIILKGIPSFPFHKLNFN